MGHSVVQYCVVFGEVCYLQVHISRDLSVLLTVKISRSISDGNVMASFCYDAVGMQAQFMFMLCML
jgi:hypothetical protein